MTHTPEEIITKLSELDADEIARLLRDEGIVGIRKMEDQCPVARYVHAMSGAYIHVGVSQCDIWNDGQIRKVLLPRSVKQFVIRFDRLRYPDLIQG